MPDKSFNPYASPTVGTPLSPEPVPVRGYGRMSETGLKAAIGLMVVSEVTFAVGWFLFAAATFAPYNVGVDYGLRATMTWGAFASFIVAWIVTIGLVILCRGIGMLMIALFVPFPLLGSFAFLACINHTRQTFVVNGYTPGFLGASPDEAERAKMAAEPYYRPSLNFDRQGEKRNLSAAMTHMLLAIAALGFLAQMFLG